MSWQTLNQAAVAGLTTASNVQHATLAAGTSTFTAGFYINCVGAAHFGLATGWYFSPNNANTSSWAHSANTDDNSFWIGYNGYNDGADRYRDLYIGDGRNAETAHFDGSTHQLYVVGDCSALTFTDRP